MFIFFTVLKNLLFVCQQPFSNPIFLYFLTLIHTPKIFSFFQKSISFSTNADHLHTIFLPNPILYGVLFFSLLITVLNEILPYRIQIPIT
jgi:hypothetical protein